MFYNRLVPQAITSMQWRQLKWLPFISHIQNGLTKIMDLISKNLCVQSCMCACSWASRDWGFIQFVKPMNNNQYPAQMYYMRFSMAVSCVLWGASLAALLHKQVWHFSLYSCNSLKIRPRFMSDQFRRLGNYKRFTQVTITEKTIWLINT